MSEHLLQDFKFVRFDNPACRALAANVMLAYKDGPLDLSYFSGIPILAQEVESITICDCGEMVIGSSSWKSLVFQDHSYTAGPIWPQHLP